MRVLICGGRTFENAKLVNKTMREIETEVSCVIEGGARGADYLGKIWAEKRGIPVFECRANWLRYGKRAGPVRNQWMIDHGKPDLVIAFPGGVGTMDMVMRARRAGVRVIEAASAGEAGTAETTKIGSAEGEHAVPKADAQAQVTPSQALGR